MHFYQVILKFSFSEKLSIICNIFSGVRYKKKNEGGLDSGTLDNTY